MNILYDLLVLGHAVSVSNMSMAGPMPITTRNSMAQMNVALRFRGFVVLSCGGLTRFRSDVFPGQVQEASDSAAIDMLNDARKTEQFLPLSTRGVS